MCILLFRFILSLHSFLKLLLQKLHLSNIVLQIIKKLSNSPTSSQNSTPIYQHKIWTNAETTDTPPFLNLSININNILVTFG